MPQRERSALSNIGFLAIVRNVSHGVFGGLLVVNPVGRPLEFHCTAPVKPNRAQEILYGPTLEEYLLGEQIGHTLFQKAKSSPQIVFTDALPVLALATCVKAPVLYVAAAMPEGDFSAANHTTSDQGHYVFFELEEVGKVAMHEAQNSQQEDTRQIADQIVRRIDLCEPFGRIREAIQEAQQAA